MDKPILGVGTRKLCDVGAFNDDDIEVCERSLRAYIDGGLLGRLLDPSCRRYCH